MKRYTILFLSFGLLLATGCSKDADNDLNNKNLSVEEVKAQMHINSATEGLDELLAAMMINNKSGSTAKNGSDCAVLSLTETSISVAYNQCTINGDMLDGTITLTGNDGNLEGTNGSFVISFNAFRFNDYLLDGKKSITFDFSATNSPVFTIVTDMGLKNDEGEIKHKGSKILTWHLGQLDGGEPDYSWTGEWDIAHKGTTYKFKVTEPLSGALDCAYITAGVLVLEVDGVIASLDFGQGACDQKGTVKYPNGESEEIN